MNKSKDELRKRLKDAEPIEPTDASELLDKLSKAAGEPPDKKDK